MENVIQYNYQANSPEEAKVVADIEQFVPEGQRTMILASFGTITHRDLMFYMAGKGAGLKMARDSFHSSEQEQDHAI